MFKHDFNVRKTKRIAKFDGLESVLCGDIRAIVAPETEPKRFGTFAKRASGGLPADLAGYFVTFTKVERCI